MKIKLYLFFLCAYICFSSCNNDNPKDIIVNKWKVTDIDIPNMPIPDSVKASVMKGTMEFTKDGKMLLSGMGDGKPKTYSMSEDGKTLFVLSDNKTETNEIKELTKTKLILFDKSNNSKIILTPK